MKRDELLAEIARLDEEINRIVTSVELPHIDHRPFPMGLWLFCGICFAWYYFGDRLPGIYSYYVMSAHYAWYAGIIFILIAIYATLRWALGGRSYHRQSQEYTQASLQARELQERRRELQAELRAISAE